MTLRLHETSPWTELLVSKLTAMHADGLSYAQIGAELKISRNAAIGKASRLGLPPREKKGRPRIARAYPKHRRTPRVKWQPSVRLPKMEVEPMPVVDDSNIPIEQRCTLDQLTSTTCRWPVGTPGQSDFFYCGYPSADLNIGIPYCPIHGARAVQGSPLRRPYIPMRSERG